MTQNNFQQGYKDKKTSISEKIHNFFTDQIRYREFISCLVIGAILLGAAACVMSIISLNRTNDPITLHSGTDGNSANFTEGSIAEVANRVSRSVVSIVTETSVQSIFGESTGSAAGTGVIVSGDGYVLTNKHVISGAKTIQVVTADGQIFKNVSVVATDPINDVAFLKIADASNLQAATLGDSKTVQAGQQVVAIGNALGEYQNTVTAGIISGTGRSLTASDGTSSSSTETLTDMIQTDAAINSGNSGGPLINAAGQVIGINTATTSNADNIGFAIPISSVKGMLESLLSTGKAERAYIGVRSISITPEIATAFELPVKAGAYVYSNNAKYPAVVSGSPAAKAGIKDKDIITAINGSNIGTAGSLTSLIGEYKPGDTIQLTIIRDGQTITTNVTLEAYKK